VIKPISSPTDCRVTLLPLAQTFTTGVGGVNSAELFCACSQASC